MANRSVKVLDCTLRDGGYYNNWNFDFSLVKNYIEAIKLSRIDIIEIGFRFLNKVDDFGPFAYSDNKFLDSFDISSSLEVAVMIDAKEFINFYPSIDEIISSNFTLAKECRIDIVRIATNIENLNVCYKISKSLKSLGYKVFLNLMQVDLLVEEDLKQTIQEITSWDTINTFYFADSFGNMNESSVNRTIKIIRKYWHKDIGIHAHDNKGHALMNSICALNLGINYIDSTIQGMGRGAGNTKTENLLVELKDKKIGDYEPEAVFLVALNEFQDLKDKYNWGSSIFYYLSAVHGIHPSYIQEMISDGRYSSVEILEAIKVLTNEVSSSYSFENLLNVLSRTSMKTGSWSVRDFCSNRDALIIGSGPSSKKYLKEIKTFIKTNKPLVLCLNVNKDFPDTLVDYYVACHESRIAMELKLYKALRKPLIIPSSRIPEEIRTFFNGVKTLDYGLSISDIDITSSEYGCCLSSPLVLIYALNLLNESKAKRVFITGIDGYIASDEKQNIMLREISNFNAKTRLELFSLTPTSYPIKEQLIID